MIYLGLLGFILYFIYDLNQCTIKHNLLKPTFTVGSFCLSYAWFSILFKGPLIIYNLSVQIILAIIAIISLGLLIYTLFFAIPFKQTYVDEKFNKVTRSGIYGICRHPGVIFFLAFTVFSSLALGNNALFLASIIFNICNLLYVIFQDVYVFPRCFDDYLDYKNCVPFLIPRINLK